MICRIVPAGVMADPLVSFGVYVRGIRVSRLIAERAVFRPPVLSRSIIAAAAVLATTSIVFAAWIARVAASVVMGPILRCRILRISRAILRRCPMRGRRTMCRDVSTSHFMLTAWLLPSAALLAAGLLIPAALLTALLLRHRRERKRHHNCNHSNQLVHIQIVSTRPYYFRRVK